MGGLTYQVFLPGEVSRHVERGGVRQPAGLGQREGVVEKGGAVHRRERGGVLQQLGGQRGPVGGRVVDTVVTELANTENTTCLLSSPRKTLTNFTILHSLEFEPGRVVRDLDGDHAVLSLKPGPG